MSFPIAVGGGIVILYLPPASGLHYVWFRRKW